MNKLIAKRAVLYRGRQYEPGEILPGYDSKMVEAWLRAGSAELQVEKAVPPAPPQDNETGQSDPGQQPEDEQMPTANLDSKSLMAMGKDELEKLAADMGVELPRGAAKALIVEMLTAKAATVQ